MIRYEFIHDSILEKDLHPHTVYDKEQKIARLFVSDHPMGSQACAPCPVCGCEKREVLFEKWGYRYALCRKSWTLGLCELPGPGVIFDYFHTSDLALYRASEAYQTLVARNRQDLWESLMGWVEGRVNRYLGHDQYQMADWGSKYIQWVHLLNAAVFVKNLTVIEPLPPIHPEPQVGGPFDIITLLDVIQREANPEHLLKRVWENLRAGGLLVASCRAGSGFDVLTLKGKSTSIFPFDHITLPSPQGIAMLLKKAGFEVMEVTTPGLLDMELIRNNKESIPNDQVFLHYILEQKDALLLERMQGFLQRNNLSSHLRCVARKNIK
jgi:hypothetical protein